MATKLEPCGLCGKRPKRITAHIGADLHGYVCGKHGDHWIYVYGKTKESAVRKWNRAFKRKETRDGH